jgi:hypothetical protein
MKKFVIMVLFAGIAVLGWWLMTEWKQRTGFLWLNLTPRPVTIAIFVFGIVGFFASFFIGEK